MPLPPNAFKRLTSPGSPDERFQRVCARVRRGGRSPLRGPQTVVVNANALPRLNPELLLGAALAALFCRMVNDD